MCLGGGCRASCLTVNQLQGTTRIPERLPPLCVSKFFVSTLEAESNSSPQNSCCIHCTVAHRQIYRFNFPVKPSIFLLTACGLWEVGLHTCWQGVEGARLELPWRRPTACLPQGRHLREETRCVCKGNQPIGKRQEDRLEPWGQCSTSSQGRDPGEKSQCTEGALSSSPLSPTALPPSSPHTHPWSLPGVIRECRAMGKGGGPQTNKIRNKRYFKKCVLGPLI